MIIFISGSINSGKSTVAKTVTKKIGNAALVELDAFHNFIDWMPIDEAVPIILDNAVSVIRNFVKRNLNIVVPYPLSKKNYNFVIKNLQDINQKIFFFVLNPKIDGILLGRGRKLTKWERERIKYHYQIGINNPGFGIVIDNSNQSPREVAKTILDKVKVNS